MKYYITYTVQGFEGRQKAGPYSQKDADYHLRDIAGFEGVMGARITPEDEMPATTVAERLQDPII
jgi:hypothetical protein